MHFDYSKLLSLALTDHNSLSFVNLLFTAETEPHEGKRKVEALWPIFKIHHQKSRYIYDLFYRRKAISRGGLHTQGWLIYLVCDYVHTRYDSVGVYI
jgi:hypothetical protein